MKTEATKTEAALPMHEPWLFHVTLNTGEVRKCFRREVSDEAVKAGDAMLSAVLQSDAQHDALKEAERNEVRDGDYAPIPWMDGYYLTGTNTRRNALLTVWRGNPSGVLRDRVVTMGIGTHSRGGTSLFRLLIDTAGTQIDTSVSRCPPEPWVAERLEPDSAMCTREVLIKLSDLQRILGWAWIHRLKGIKARRD